MKTLMLHKRGHHINAVQYKNLKAMQLVNKNLFDVLIRFITALKLWSGPEPCYG